MINMLLVSLMLDKIDMLAYMHVCRAIRKGAVAAAPFRLMLLHIFSDQLLDIARHASLRYKVFVQVKLIRTEDDSSSFHLLLIVLRRSSLLRVANWHDGSFPGIINKP